MVDRIVGVVGSSSKNVPEEVLDTAQVVGALLAAKGCVVLTGGSHDDPKQRSVKARAIRGARIADPRGRVLGILKEGGRLRKPDSCTAYVRTGQDHLRNILNGLAADVLIALPGDRGTLSEIFFADRAGRRTVFLGWDARDVLRRIRKRGEGVVSIVNQAQDLGYACGEDPIVRLTDLVEKRFLAATTAKQAVGSAARARPRWGADVQAALAADGDLEVMGRTLLNQFTQALDWLDEPDCRPS